MRDVHAITIWNRINRSCSRPPPLLRGLPTECPCGAAAQPAGYAALRSAGFDAPSWGRASALHDPNLLRKAGRAGWRDAGMPRRLRALDEQAATLATGALDAAVSEQQAAEKPAKRSKKRRGIRRRGRSLASGRVRPARRTQKHPSSY